MPTDTCILILTYLAAAFAGYLFAALVTTLLEFFGGRFR